jgi:hypothetical protein
MSIPDIEEGRSFKMSAFKIFGRKNSNRNRPPKLLQLPDNAVAAKTLSGSRHIAISIPLQYDHPENGQPSSRSIHPLQSSPPKYPPPVTVLKPVVEGRESTSSHRKSSLEGREGKRGGGHSQQVSLTAPAAELLGPETAKTLRNYYTQLNRQHKVKAESISSIKTGESKSQRSIHAGTSTDSMRQDSQSADPRHSGGTVYSAITISPQDYSGRLSSVSPAPSMNPTSPAKVDLPFRNSSIPKVPKPILTELAQSYRAANFPSQQDPPRSSVLPDRTESLTSETSTYSSPSAVIGTAETERGYNTAAGLQYASGQTPKPMSPLPAPTRGLPDVPESPCIPDFLPSPSRPISRRRITIGLIDEVARPSSMPVQSNADYSLSPTSQTRQERVRARKSRDMAALREKRASRDMISDAESNAAISRASSPGSRPSSSPPTRKRRSMSRDKMRRSRISISPIMLVADLVPHNGTGYLPNSPTKKAARKQVSGTNLAARGTYTPPRSSMGSDSDTNPKTGEANGFSPTSASADQGLDNRRQERRVKRNMSLREKEMEIRLRKIERDNAMLMTTLTGIAGSFGQLNGLLPRPRTDSGPLIRDEIGRPKEVEEEIQKLEPVMRELQAGAGRVSMEGSPSRPVLGAEDDEGSNS